MIYIKYFKPLKLFIKNPFFFKWKKYDLKNSRLTEIINRRHPIKFSFIFSFHNKPFHKTSNVIFCFREKLLWVFPQFSLITSLHLLTRKTDIPFQIIN